MLFPVRHTVDSSDVSRNTMLLRPKCAESSIMKRENITSSEGSRIRDNDMLQKAITQADIQTPSWKIVDEKKWGIGWKNALKCQSCGFKSQAHPTYRNVPSAKRGPDPAASKVALAVRLQDTPMGSTRCRLLLANLDIPPPARSSMQRRSDAAGQAVTELTSRTWLKKCKR